mmetsp:Transcript_89175/g.177287  ORF Transcript_89175/g.177287 Transcript_89175/m.177287 type:complete len:434 (-) Transcript_89175:58-1359(-)
MLLMVFRIVVIGLMLGQEEGVLLKEQFVADFDAPLPAGGRWLSQDPPILEVDDWMSRKACKRIIAEAQHLGLAASTTPKAGMLRHMPPEHLMQHLAGFDGDGDGRFSRPEIRASLKMAGALLADVQLLDDLEEHLGAYPTLHAFASANLADIVETAMQARPWLQLRMSEQAWLGTTSRQRQTLLKKLSQLLGVPLAEHAEDLQVVRYPGRGQYACHHDAGVRLSVNGRFAHSKLRVLTAMIYLSDVNSGGETAFPYVGTSTTLSDVQEFPVRSCQGDVATRAEEACNQTGLVVQPRRGKLVLFFNAAARQNLQSGPWQVLDVFPKAFHAGCPVGAGAEKWVAQQWIELGPVNVTSSFYHATAEGGDVDAQLFLGEAYLQGKDGLPRDPSQAVSWLRRAASAGSDEAQSLLKRASKLIKARASKASKAGRSADL